MKRVLFVCTFYGARALIAEQCAKSLNYKDMDVHSACFESGEIGPRIYTLLSEKYLHKNAKPPMLVWDRYNNNEKFDIVVTLCHDLSSEQCPVFNANIDTLYGNVAKIIRWSIPDFTHLKKHDEELWFSEAREIRDLIMYKSTILMQELSEVAI